MTTTFTFSGPIIHTDHSLKIVVGHRLNYY